ncbi:MAG: rane protein [Gammaproteobacteria bacterium]|jgi:membrane protein YqaA with SNARE-associated domain|nr:rane protein [Gammaproteobacteria bacterium]
MKIFSPLYKKMLQWARHPRAPMFLFWLSFAESSFFPIPPDVMLAPMVLAKPEQGWRNAWLCTAGGVLGAYVGYVIGMFFFLMIKPLLIKLGYMPHYETIVAWFDKWGFWVMFFAGFAFIPYKLFTIAAGATGLGLIPFTLGSLVGRGGRFFLVTALIKMGGVKMERWLQDYIDHLAWFFILLFVLGYFLWRTLH